MIRNGETPVREHGFGYLFCITVITLVMLVAVFGALNGVALTTATIGRSALEYADREMEPLPDAPGRSPHRAGGIGESGQGIAAVCSLEILEEAERPVRAAVNGIGYGDRRFR